MVTQPFPAAHDASEPSDLCPALEAAGFRTGSRGTHSSRTIMRAELDELLAAKPGPCSREEYSGAIVDDNVLGKQTTATRRTTDQRLGELYGLDPKLPIFRALRRTWSADPTGRPLLAMLVALARDPLLRSTAPLVLSLPVGAELVRAGLLDAIRQSAGSRLNEAVLDKVARNAASSWSQSGHLKGRVRKLRQRVTPTPGVAALALWLGTCEGLAGEALLDTRWTRVLDRSKHELLPAALEAKRLGLIHARVGGGVVELNPSALVTPAARR